METPHSEELEPQAERDSRLDQLNELARELDFEEPAELLSLRADTIAALRDDDTDLAHAVEILTAYQKAAAAFVESRDRRSNAHVGYRIAVATIWLEGGKIDEGLDELWETAWQAGQTPGIETLREALEDFVAHF